MTMTEEPIRTADECARHLIADEGWDPDEAWRAVDEIVADRDDDRMSELEWELALRPYVEVSEADPESITVAELRDLLAGLPDTAEVRLAIQPSWPFEHRISRHGVVRSGRHVYIGEGGQIGYLPSSVKSAVWA